MREVGDNIRLFDIKSLDIAISSVKVNDIHRDEVESDIICQDRINPISSDLTSNNCVILYPAQWIYIPSLWILETISIFSDISWKRFSSDGLGQTSL